MDGLESKLRDLRVRRHDARTTMDMVLKRGEQAGGRMTQAEMREFDQAEAEFDRADAEIRLETGGVRVRGGNALLDAVRADDARGGLRSPTPDDESGIAPEWRDGNGGPRPGALMAEARAVLSSDGGIGQVLTPPEQHKAVIQRLEALSVFLAAGAPIVTTANTSITFPHETGSTADLADWVAEGAEITDADPGGEGIEVTPRKVAALVKASNESLGDSNPSALAHIENRLMRALALKADLGFFEGTGTAPQIRGLANVVGLPTVDMGTDGAALTDLDPFADALGAVVEADADEDRVAIFMHGRTWKALLKLKEQDTGSNKPLLVEQTVGPTGKVRRSIYGRPVYLTSQLSTGETHGTAENASSAYVVDMSRVLVVVRQGSTVALDRSAAFTSDSSLIRATARLAPYVPEPEAACRIEGIIPAT